MNHLRTKTNTLEIETGDGIVFPLFLASPVTRFLSWAIDGICVTILLGMVMRGVSALGWIQPDLIMAITTLIYFAVSMGYGMVLEWYWRGQTLGKRLFRLRVMDAQGLRLQFSQIVVRNLLRAVDGLPILYLVGGVTCLLNRYSQRLGDLAANTVVVRMVPGDDTGLEQMFAGKYNSFREYPHLAARLRQRVSPGEAGIALRAILRREELTPSSRVDLFASLAGYFRDVQRFPQEATDGITDEQYVRNVVDVLFRTRV